MDVCGCPEYDPLVRRYRWKGRGEQAVNSSNNYKSECSGTFNNRIPIHATAIHLFI